MKKRELDKRGSQYDARDAQRQFGQAVELEECYGCGRRTTDLEAHKRAGCKQRRQPKGEEE